ncbi:hypothetical protein [Streptomyces sp. PTD5-9]|uniref:hypothetical protein n=1 Tax=Streptomyces sp. PTD5-9 TaxID=3120150 RepID=UPI00300A833D
MNPADRQADPAGTASVLAYGSLHTAQQALPEYRRNAARALACWGDSLAATAPELAGRVQGVAFDADTGCLDVVPDAPATPTVLLAAACRRPANGPSASPPERSRHRRAP